MPKLNVVKNLMLVENVSCVFRNYSYFGRKLKSVVKLIIFLSVTLYVYAFIHFFSTILFILNISNSVGLCIMITYNFFSKTNTIVAIVLGVINAQSFKKYVNGVDAVYELCNHDVLYRSSIKKMTKRVRFVAILCAGISMGLMPVNLINNERFLKDTKVILIDLILDAMISYRYIMENLAFYAYIEVVVAGLQYLNEAVSVAVKKFKHDHVEACEIQTFLKLGEDLEHWGTVSGLLLGCSDQLKICFGVQIGLSMFSAVVYYIILIYQCVSKLTNKKFMEFEWAGLGLMFILISFIVIKILITNASQRARNEADQLGTSIAALRTLLVGIPGCEASSVCARASALARRLRTVPLRMRLLSAYSLQMTMLVEIFAVVANFTIILLQFNHVV